MPSDSSDSSPLSIDDLLTFSKTPIDEPITPSELIPALSTPPFIPLPNALNLRDLSSPLTPALKANRIYRSGSLALSAPAIRQLNLRKIFDLRSDAERRKRPIAEVEGVDVVWCPVDQEPGRVEPRDFVDAGEGYVKMYGDCLRTHVSAYKGVLEGIRDLPEDGDGGEGGALLFCCTAGKDRTGVLAAIILSIAGVPVRTIAQEYALTRIGVEPAREMLMAHLTQGNPEMSLDKPGMKGLCSVDAANMEVFLRWVEENIQGGVEGYCVGKLGLTEEDLAAVRRRLVQ